MVHQRKFNSKKIKIVILGSEGQLGTELFNSLSQSYLTIGISKNKWKNPNKYFGNLYFPKKVIDSLKIISPNIIINCAAYTNVQGCETNKNYAMRVNGSSLKKISEYCLNNKIFLLHFSTDYIFSGEKISEYNEHDLPNPINTYGKSKLLSENYIRLSGCYYAILRISWVFSFYGSNFMKKILSLSKNQKSIEIVCDQFGKPTSTNLISKAVEKLIIKELKENKLKIKETYHLSCKRKTNWFDFAKEIIENSSSNYEKKITLKKTYSTKNLKVKRPINSSLNTNKFEKKYNYTLPSWKEELKLVIKKIQEYEK